MTLTERREALSALKYSGVLETAVDGKRVRYRDMHELETALADLDRQIAAEQGAARPVARVAVFRR